MKKLKQAIKKSGYRKDHIAAKMGITPQYLSRILNGKQKLRNPAPFIERVKSVIDGNK